MRSDFWLRGLCAEHSVTLGPGVGGQMSVTEGRGRIRVRGSDYFVRWWGRVEQLFGL